MTFRKTRILLTVMMVCGLLAFSADSACSGTLGETVAEAVNTNPEIQTKWHAFMAAGNEQEAARGGYLPRLDLTAGIGREERDGPGYEGRDMMGYTRKGAFLTLTQMIYDGYLTKNQVGKLGHARKKNYFELLYSMESVALSAVRSHLDVNRYRTLTEYASRNLQQHEAIAKMIEKRIRAGIDSKVDMETVKGRVALARANLLTEESNLHDAETQFIRVIGTSPGDLHDASLETAHLPSSAEAALEEVFKGSPQLFAAVEHSLSMDSALAEQGARMRPTLDLRAGLNLEEDVGGVSGRRDETYVELLLRWNLYNGGSDQATIHRFEELYKQSRENVKRVERDIRQAVLIAYNNIISLRKQITHLEQHKTSAEIMREAFEKQFVVGRRSLLDLLDAENEVFQAKRALLNAKVNLSIAQAEYMAETGKLVNYFKTTRQDVPQPDDLGIDVVTYQSLQAD